MIEQLENPHFMRDLGKMVMIDLCLGNIDRWNQGRCAPGNMMVTADAHLALIDHESRLESMETTQVQEQIYQLVKGNAARQLFMNMNESLQHEWAKRGEKLDQRQIPNFSQIDHFQRGLLEGARQLCAFFPHKEAWEAFAGRNVLSSDKVDTSKL